MHDANQITSRVAATAIIADDEPILRLHLNQLLAEVWPELDIICLVGDGQTAISAVQEHRPDIVFLDIQMPAMSGLDVAQQLVNAKGNYCPMVVFITAFDHYAVAAFEQSAIDYILKPVAEARLNQACNKLQQRLTTPDGAVTSNDITKLLQQIQQLSQVTAPTFLQWLKVKQGEDMHLVAIEDVVYFRADNKYTSVYVVDTPTAGARSSGVKEYLLRTSLKELLPQLNPQQFWQVHRSIIVNLSAIEKVSKALSGSMFIHTHGVRLPVSRAMESRFK